MSVGVNEKKADSAADTNATNTSNTNIMAMETAILTVKGLITMLKKAKDEYRLWTSKIWGFNETKMFDHKDKHCDQTCEFTFST